MHTEKTAVAVAGPGTMPFVRRAIGGRRPVGPATRVAMAIMVSFVVLAGAVVAAVAAGVTRGISSIRQPATRVRKLVVLVGTLKALAIAVWNTEVRRRVTLLRQRLQALDGVPALPRCSPIQGWRDNMETRTRQRRVGRPQLGGGFASAHAWFCGSTRRRATWSGQTS